MDKKTKRNLLIIGIVEAVILIFCLVVAIITIATIQTPEAAAVSGKTNTEVNGPFIGYLQDHSVLFFCVIPLPCFIILLVDGVYLIVYATKRQSMVSDKERSEIEEEARKQAREEVLREMQQEKEEKK